jgi:hypothetical protein
MDFGSYRLYEQGAGPEPRIVRLVTRDEGECMVHSETALAGVDRDGRTLCFLLQEASAASAVPTYRETKKSSKLTGMDLEPSNAVFTRPEMMAIAGSNFKHGRSRTASMNELQREARAKRIYEASLLKTSCPVKVGPEDMVERATNKMKAWAQIPVLQDRMRTVASL